MVLSGCQSDLPSGNSFSGFEGYNMELTDEELKNAMKNGKVELENRPDENICYISITCKTAIESGELSDSMLSVLPEDGTVLEKLEVSYEDGATVPDVYLISAFENINPNGNGKNITMGNTNLSGAASGTKVTDDNKATEAYFNAKAGINRIRVYLWMEGNDVDCENSVAGATLGFNLVLTIK